jgi:hypothetical protein
VPCTRARTFRVSADRQMHHRSGSAVALHCAARTAGSSCRRTVLTVESQPVVFRSVLSTTGVVTAPWSSLLLCVHKIFLFFDVGSFCAARGNFPSFTPTSSKHWSYRCTARPSSDPLGLRGIIFIHFAGGHPFPLQSSLPRDVSRLALVWRRENSLQDLFHAPMPPALPHAHCRRRISWNFDTPIAFEAHKLMIA